MEIEDIANIVAAIAAVIGLIITVIQAIRIRRINIIITTRGFWISVFLMLIFAALTLWLWTVPPPDSSRYGFESEPIEWVKQEFKDSQGVLDVAQSADQAKLGKYSLKLTADLEGGHPNRSKGEAYVEINPQNLQNQPITVWVYVPKEAIGDPMRPNGIQVFVKDKDWKAEYGTWWNITPARVDDWHQVTLAPSTSAPPDGYMEPGFDPTHIRAVGVKVAIGEGSTARYRGPIYIDAVNWPQ